VFALRSYKSFNRFYPYGEYKVVNHDLAELLVRQSLERLYEVNLFGSGYPISPSMGYPQMLFEMNLAVLYDITQDKLDLTSEGNLRHLNLEQE
jgi:hypothetical protein